MIHYGEKELEKSPHLFITKTIVASFGYDIILLVGSVGSLSDKYSIAILLCVFFFLISAVILFYMSLCPLNFYLLIIYVIL